MLGILIALVTFAKAADAGDAPENLCIIVVPGELGYSSHETGKALSFHDYLVDTGYGEDDIHFLAGASVPDNDGPATVSNIETAFSWVTETSRPGTELLIYIFDHQEIVFGETWFLFDDGNISSETIDRWIGDIVCSGVTVILNGERSALAGPVLSGPSRDIICSMGASQEFDPDLFN
ncbi:MAG: hypothetical protein JXA22_01055, partial [Candidatus Thermoplasmatota archaeon]|nr:hypothetical protein [Candidatus Thermoplasmatota archaeon]